MTRQKFLELFLLNTRQRSKLANYKGLTLDYDSCRCPQLEIKISEEVFIIRTTVEQIKAAIANGFTIHERSEIHPSKLNNLLVNEITAFGITLRS